MDLAAEVERVWQRARLAEQALLDATVARALAEAASAGHLGPLVAVTWSRDTPPAGVPADQVVYTRRAGRVELLGASAAEALEASGYVVAHSPLHLPRERRPEAAAELRTVAAVLLEAADALDPTPPTI